MRKNTKIGDVFEVTIDSNHKKYLQYIVSDLTQLNSDVIRAFKKSYPIESEPGIDEIVSGEVEFYAHCVTKIGIMLAYWKKVGNSEEVGDTDHILFRSSKDYGVKAGEDPVKISYKWEVWKINEERKYIGALEEAYRKAEMGTVMPPDSVVYRMKTGKYIGIYPGYE